MKYYISTPLSATRFFEFAKPQIRTGCSKECALLGLLRVARRGRANSRARPCRSGPLFSLLTFQRQDHNVFEVHLFPSVPLTHAVTRMGRCVLGSTRKPPSAKALRLFSERTVEFTKTIEHSKLKNHVSVRNTQLTSLGNLRAKQLTSQLRI